LSNQAWKAFEAAAVAVQETEKAGNPLAAAQLAKKAARALLDSQRAMLTELAELRKLMGVPDEVAR